MPCCQREGQFDAVPTTNWGRPETLDMWRRTWADMVNMRFEEKGLEIPFKQMDVHVVS